MALHCTMRRDKYNGKHYRKIKLPRTDALKPKARARDDAPSGPIQFPSRHKWRNADGGAEPNESAMTCAPASSIALRCKLRDVMRQLWLVKDFMSDASPAVSVP